MLVKIKNYKKYMQYFLFLMMPVFALFLLCFIQKVSLFDIDWWNSTWNDEVIYHKTIKVMREFGHPTAISVLWNLDYHCVYPLLAVFFSYRHRFPRFHDYGKCDDGRHCKRNFLFFGQAQGRAGFLFVYVFHIIVNLSAVCLVGHE